MSLKETDGATTAQHLARAQENPWLGHRVKIEAFTSAAPVPTRLLYLWGIFWGIARARRSGMGGPEALSYADIYYWQLVAKQELRDNEVGLIFDLDRLFLETHAQVKK